MGKGSAKRSAEVTRTLTRMMMMMMAAPVKRRQTPATVTPKQKITPQRVNVPLFAAKRGASNTASCGKYSRLWLAIVESMNCCTSSMTFQCGPQWEQRRMSGTDMAFHCAWFWRIAHGQLNIGESVTKPLLICSANVVMLRCFAPGRLTRNRLLTTNGLWESNSCWVGLGST